MTSRCSTCAHFVHPARPQTTRGRCAKWDARKGGAKGEPTFGCSHHERRLEPLDRQFLRLLVDGARTDIEDARKALNKAQRRVRHLEKRLGG